MKKIREETTEYYQRDDGGIIVKTEERFLVTEKDGEECWVTYSKSIPLVWYIFYVDYWHDLCLSRANMLGGVGPLLESMNETDSHRHQDRTDPAH